MHLSGEAEGYAIMPVGHRSMKLNTYVNFAGKCAEAFGFYEQHLGGKVSMLMTRGELPDQSQVKPESKGAVVHARILIGATELMGSDVDDAQPMRSAYLSLNLQSDSEAEPIFLALSGWRNLYGDAGDVLRYTIRAIARSLRDQLDASV